MLNRRDLIKSMAGAIIGLAVVPACGNEERPEVVVYSSVDEVFSRPIAEAFEKKFGIRVLFVPDTEETKSTGLVNRLLIEKESPHCDVFWSGDPMRAEILKSKGVTAVYRSKAAAGLPMQYSDPDGHWTGFSTRARVLIYNQALVKNTELPTSFRDLVAPRFKGKCCIANPMFGTTSMHFAALFETLGETDADAFLKALEKADCKILTSNGDVKRRVAAGEYAIGFTDTDDAYVAMSEKKPIGVVWADQAPSEIGTLLVPNAACLIADGPNAENGRKFIDYLVSAEVEAALAKSDAAQIPLRSDIPGPSVFPAIGTVKAMPINYAKLAQRTEALTGGRLQDWLDMMR